MCYDVRYLTKRIKKYADHAGGDPEEVERMEKQLRVFKEQVGAVYHTTAFQHWKLPVLTHNQPKDFQFFQWGFIPQFVKNTEEYFKKYSTRYLNSRIETLFDEKIFNEQFNRNMENPYFKSAVDRRCLVVLDGYFDWHWQGKNSYNFHIKLKSDEPMYVAGIWRTWKSKDEDVSWDTVSLVTTDANPLCHMVHNKPKGSEGPRQLAIMDQEMAATWMDVDASPEILKKAIRIFPETELEAFPVKKLFLQEGKKRISLNEESCVEEVHFPELDFGKKETGGQGSLF